MEMEVANEELRVTNEELRDVNDRMAWWDGIVRYVVEHDPSAIAILDAELHFLYVSERFRKDYRVNNRDIIGRHHYDVFPEIPERWRDVHRRALAGEVLRSADDSFVRLDGSVDHTWWECRPWYQVDGTVGGIIIYTEVLNRRKFVEQPQEK